MHAPYIVVTLHIIVSSGRHTHNDMPLVTGTFCKEGHNETEED